MDEVGFCPVVSGFCPVGFCPVGFCQCGVLSCGVLSVHRPQKGFPSQWWGRSNLQNIQSALSSSL